MVVCTFFGTALLWDWASFTEQLVKNPPAMQETRFNSWVRKICWRRDRLPIPVFLGFPCSSAGKESVCNAGDGFSPWVGMFPWRRKRASTPVFWPREFHGPYSPWGYKELGTTERLSVHFTANIISLEFSFISYSYKCIFLSCRNGSYTSIHMLLKL